MNHFDDHSFSLFNHSPLFKGLGEEERRNLFSLSKEMVLEPGQFLIEEGEKATDLFVVIQGSFEIFTHDTEMKQRYLLDEVGPGDILGEVAFLDRSERAASAIANTVSRVRGIPFETLNELIGKNKAYLPLFPPPKRRLTMSPLAWSSAWMGKSLRQDRERQKN